MKKVTVNFIAQEDEYKEVSGGDRYPKWDFKNNPKLECVLMERKTLPNTNKTGTYDLYTVIEKYTKKPFVFFCGTVLIDKLKNIPIFSMVKIEFTGIHPIKKYHNFKVGQNLNFRYDPQQWNLDNFAEVKNEDTQPGSFNKPASSISNNTQAQQVEDDLPF